jgi:CheY-like chemotaxis protein
VLSPVADATPAGQKARRLVIEARCAQAQGGSGLDLLQQAAQWVRGHPHAQERLGVELMLAMRQQGHDGLALCRSVRDAAATHELEGIAMTAATFEADLLRRLGRADEAGTAAFALINRIDLCAPFDLYAGEFWWIVVQALDAAHQPAAARHALQRGAAWVKAALPQVPEPFRHSFLHRQPVNRALLSAARLRLDTGDPGPPT